MIKKISLNGFFLLLLSNATIYAFPDSTFSNIHISARFHYGFTMAHTKTIEYVVNGRVPGFELIISRPSWGKHVYPQYYRYPQTGMSFFRCYFQHYDILGAASGLYPFIAIPFAIHKPLNNYYYSIGFGLAYLEKTFSIEKNLYNTAIGTKMNILFNFSFGGQQYITPRLALRENIGITHFSNGNIKKPNLGLNYISYAMGLSYILKPHPLMPVQYLPQMFNKYEYHCVLSGGARSYALYNNSLFFASSLSAGLGHYISNRHKPGIGGDIFYSEAIALYLKDKNINNISCSKKMQYGIHAFHDLIYNRLILTVQVGKYVHAAFSEKPVYSRFGIRYKLNNYLLANLALKTHYASADFVEFGLGYYGNK